MAKRKGSEDDFDVETAEPDAPPEDIVSNAAEVPLFAGAGFANNRSIAKLKLVKLDNPGAGYKGEIPLNSTLETIGQLFGDGLYNIEAVNGRGTRLRALENQRIALGFSVFDAQAKPSATVSAPHSDVDRIERLARQSANESVQQATAFRDLVVATTNAAASREREFLQGVTTQSQAFMASLMTSQAQGFAQMMAMMQAGHQHVIESLGAVAKSKSSDSDSIEKLMAIFMQGMQLGRGMDSPEEQPFWQEIVRGGMGFLGAARESQLAASNPAVPAKPAKATGGKLGRLVSAMRKRGIDADSLISMLESGGNAPATELEPDDESEASREDERPEGPIFTSP